MDLTTRPHKSSLMGTPNFSFQQYDLRSRCYVVAMNGRIKNPFSKSNSDGPAETRYILLTLILNGSTEVLLFEISHLNMIERSITAVGQHKHGTLKQLMGAQHICPGLIHTI